MRIVATNRGRGGIVFRHLLVGLLWLVSAFFRAEAASAVALPQRLPSSTAPAKGTYSGLFYEPSRVALGHSGFVTLTVTERGYFSGSLLLGKDRYSGRGQFAPGTPLTTSLWRHGGKLLVVTLQPNPIPQAEGLVGSISTPNWTAELLADRAIFDARTNPAPFAGTYTLAISRAASSPTAPGGESCAVLRVDTGGKVTLTGTLADGTAVAQRAPLSKTGDWPLFASLYAGRGSVLSWLSFSNQPAADVQGTLSWIQPPTQRSKPFPAALDSSVRQVYGSRYLPPVRTNEALHLTNALICFAGSASLSEPFTQAVRLACSPGQGSAVATSRKLTFALRLSTGEFTGTVALPGAAARVPFKGVVLQKQNRGAGFFLHDGQSGLVSLGMGQEE